MAGTSSETKGIDEGSANTLNSQDFTEGIHEAAQPTEKSEDDTSSSGVTASLGATDRAVGAEIPSLSSSSDSSSGGGLFGK